MKYIILFAILLSGCSLNSSDQKYFHIHETCALNSDKIKSAAEAWNTVCGKPILIESDLESSVDLAEVLCTINPYIIEYYKNRSNNQNMVGNFSIEEDGSKNIAILQSFDDWTFENTTMHEFGHYLGLDHNKKDINSIMQPVINMTVSYPSKEDIMNLNKTGYGCR